MINGIYANITAEKRLGFLKRFFRL